jgi:capsular exopolysaccharide synthesis family protein
MSDQLERVPYPPERRPAFRSGAPLAPVAPAPLGRADLRAYYRAIRARRTTFVAVFLCIVGASALLLAFSKPVYQARGTVVVDVPGATSSISESALLTQLFSLPGGGSVGTQTEILRSERVQFRALRKCGFKPTRKSMRRISVDPVPASDMIEISAKGKTPAAAAKLANAVIDEYLLHTKRMNQEEASRGVKHVSAELKKIRARLDKTRGQFRGLKERTGLVSLSDQTQKMVERLADLTKEQEMANAELLGSNRKQAGVRKELQREDPTLVASVTMAANPRADQLRQTLTDLETQRAALLQEYQPTSERVRSIEEQIADVQRRLSNLAKTKTEEVVRQRQETLNPRREALLQDLVQTEMVGVVAKAKRDALAPFVAELERRLSSLPKAEYEMAGLQRDIQILGAAEASLSQRLQELTLGVEAGRSNARLVDDALPPTKPNSPKVSLTLLIAVVLGLVLASVLAIGREHLDDSVKSSEEVEWILDAPVLGQIPRVRVEPLLGAKQVPPLFEEGYQLLRRNLELASQDAGSNTLLLTSAGPAEGKTITAVNLAILMARQGKRVLLVDADLRKPALHEKLKLKNDVGFSSILQGQASVQEAIQSGPVPGLSVITSGPACEMPSHLLDSSRLTDVLSVMRQFADMILLDSPPGLALSDALLLAGKVDGVLVIVGSRIAAKQGLMRLRQALDQARAHLLGAVVNAIDLSRDAPYYDQFIYYSRYYGRAPLALPAPQSPQEPPAQAEEPKAQT